MNTPLTPEQSQFMQTQMEAQQAPEPGEEQIQQAEQLETQAKELSAHNKRTQAELTVMREQTKQMELQNKIREHLQQMAMKEQQKAKEKAKAIDQSMGLASPAAEGLEGSELEAV